MITLRFYPQGDSSTTDQNQPIDYEIPPVILAESVLDIWEREAENRIDWRGTDGFYKLPNEFVLGIFSPRLQKKLNAEHVEVDPWVMVMGPSVDLLVVKWVHADNSLAKMDGRYGFVICHTRDGANHFFEFPRKWFSAFLEDHPAVTVIDGLLEHSDTNPLSILLRSPQPYKGLAQQIVAKLEA